MIQEKQLGQLRPGTTSAVSIYSPPASTTWVVKNLVVCNTTASSATFRVFHDEDGTTYDETTALFYDVPINANETLTFTSLMAGSNTAGNVAVRTDTASALNFTLYGMEIVG